MILRSRHYWFLLVVVWAVTVIGAVSTSDWGYFVVGMIASNFILIGWGFPILARLASPKMIWPGGSASLGPLAKRADLPAVLTEGPNPQVLHPESELYVLGGGVFFGLALRGTGEFMIVPKGQVIATDEPGKTIPNYLVNAYCRELNRPEEIKYSLYGSVRPHALDERTWIPREWFDILRIQDEWSWKYSILWYGDVPIHPFISLDRDGSFAFKPIGGGDPFPLRALMPNLDEDAKDKVLLDMVHLINGRHAQQVLSLREENSRLKNAIRTESDHYARMLTNITDTEEKVIRGPMQGVTEYFTSEEPTADQGVQRV